MNFKVIVLLSLISFSQFSFGQKPDSLRLINKTWIAPTLAIGIGAFGFSSGPIRELDLKIRNQVIRNGFKPTKADNFLAALPSASAFALDWLGVKSKHNFNSKGVIFLSSSAVMGISVFGLKYLTKKERPNSKDFQSFPSGHTAAAFMGAEMVYQEYKYISPWIGVGAYLVASSVGVLRITNNEHWFSDVLAGAGFGVLSTKFGYWLYPKITKKVNMNWSRTTIQPYYFNKAIGFTAAISI